MDRYLQKIISEKTDTLLTSEVLQVQALGQPVVFAWCLFQYSLPIGQGKVESECLHS